MKTLISVDEIADLFNKELEEIEHVASKESLDSKEIFGKIKSVIDASCLLLKELEEIHESEPEFLKSERINFQQRTNKIVLKSYLTTRARTWPQGYQGDYKTLETIYRNMPLSDGIGYYLDLYALTSPLAAAVRNRIRILEDILFEEIQKRKSPNIMNIACGSCRELLAVAPELKKAKAKVTCIDDDSDALNFSLTRLSQIITNLNFKFRKYNALRMFDYESNLREFGMQDIIYSAGLFDYLPDDFLINLLESLYMLLNETGKLIVAFKDCDYYDSTLFRWICDWDGFKQRNEIDFLRILDEAQIPLGNIKTMRDETNIIVFYIISKKAQQEINQVNNI